MLITTRPFRDVFQDSPCLIRPRQVSKRGSQTEQCLGASQILVPSFWLEVQGFEGPAIQAGGACEFGSRGSLLARAQRVIHGLFPRSGRQSLEKVICQLFQMRLAGKPAGGFERLADFPVQISSVASGQIRVDDFAGQRVGKLVAF
jgi:hypothetical protein